MQSQFASTYSSDRYYAEVQGLVFRHLKGYVATPVVRTEQLTFLKALGNYITNP